LPLTGLRDIRSRAKAHETVRTQRKQRENRSET